MCQSKSKSRLMVAEVVEAFVKDENESQASVGGICEQILWVGKVLSSHWIHMGLSDFVSLPLAAYIVDTPEAAMLARLHLLQWWLTSNLATHSSMNHGWPP